MVQPQAIHGAAPIARHSRTKADASARVCPECNGAGHVWIVCPDAGAVTVPCSCRRQATLPADSFMLDIALAGAFVSGCGALFLLL